MRTASQFFGRSAPPVAAGAFLLLALAVVLPPSITTLAQVAPPPPAPPTAQGVPVIGEVERLTLNTPGDVWSGGAIIVGGQVITIPRNLLIDYPANRLTLQQTFAQAPAACVANGESGLAKLDKCNTLGNGALATIAANRTSGGNVIAGDVFFQKGIETIRGTVTYINYAEGYYRLDGNPNDATTGVMVRLNDPSARHSVQLGAGCAGGPNCSPDPRFTEDPDNYTQAFETGYPMCIPSTAPRTFTDVLNLSGTPNAQLTAQANPDGSGDVLCPTTNRPAPTTAPLLANSAVVLADDSRRLAPIELGDSVLEMGNFETVNGVRFLSAWNTRIGAKIETRVAPDQPDYMIIDEMFIDAPAFQRQRTRARFQGKTTLEVSDVLLWSTHHDPTTNATHEFPLASTAGCDIAAGTGLCTLIGGVPDLWRIKYDVDYRPGPVDPKLFPCPQLKAEPRFGGGICPVNGLEDNFSVMSPITHETHARTGNKVANPNLVTIDLLGNPATNGQYLFPMGMGLGGIEGIDFAEVNPGLMATPISFSGIPWNLDRRLSPGGCIGACEATPQPLDPFPFEGLDPRTQAANVIFAGAGVPAGAYNDLTFTASPLTNDSNRILSFVDPGIGNFNGDKTILAWPPANPPAQPIVQTAGSVTAPGTPTGVVAALSSPTQATVTFTPPAANGGSAITGYVVTALINGVLPKPPIGVFVAAPATNASVGGLTSGTTYTFIVSASNGTGTGGNSVASNSVTPAAPAAPLATAPGAPTGVTATAGNAQASVSWTAPASDGGSPITSYTVTSSPAGGSATVSAPAGGGAPPTTATVTGLTNGTAFTFTVTATNAVGTSPASAPSNSVTPTAPPATVPAAPGAPVQSIATPSKLTVASPIQNSTIPVTLNWSASSSSGITSYQLQQSTNGGAFVDASVQPTGTATSATVTPPMGTLLAYQFQVRACSNPTTCSAFAVGPKFRLVPVDDNIVANIAFRGGWTVAPVPGAYGGSVHFATKPGANATLNSLTWTVVGNGAWVSTLGPDRGKATVTVDGGPPTIIDLYAPTQQPAQVVWTLGNLGPGTHTVVVTVQGAQNPASTGSRVDVDAFVVII